MENDRIMVPVHSRDEILIRQEEDKLEWLHPQTLEWKPLKLNNLLRFQRRVVFRVAVANSKEFYILDCMEIENVGPYDTYESRKREFYNEWWLGYKPHLADPVKFIWGGVDGSYHGKVKTYVFRNQGEWFETYPLSKIEK